jgi:hypothetical protein
MQLKDAKIKVEETYQHLIDYAEARWNVIALQVSDSTANAVTSILTGLSLAMIGLFFLLFLSLSLAIWLGALTNSYALGFLLVSVLYAIVGLLVYSNRQTLLFLPIMNKFLKTLYRNKDDKLI